MEERFDISPSTTFYPRSSTETYMSDESDEDEEEDFEEIDPVYDIPEYKQVVHANMRPSTTQEFANLFPSTKRLYIRHDETTYDGNMNLRIDTETREGTIQLFHLRIQDLKRRECSLRRYQRSSGREVCRSSRSYSKAEDGARPCLSRSVSNAWVNMMKRPDCKRSSSSQQSHKTIQRKDSGYASTLDVDDDLTETERAATMASLPTKTIRLEFSNYAQVDIRRKRVRASRRHEFEYWGRTYVWKRVVEKTGHEQTTSYHLYRAQGGQAIAHIVPELRSPEQIQQDDSARNWVPPCSMWISDMKVLEMVTDIAEIVIATGLMALVDDCIERHFPSKPAREAKTKVSLGDLKLDMPTKAKLSSIFRRKSSVDSTHDRDAPKLGSPLKQNRIMEH